MLGEIDKTCLNKNSYVKYFTVSSQDIDGNIFVVGSLNDKIFWYVLNVFPPLAKYSNSWQDIHWWRPSRLPARASKHQTQASYRLQIYIFFFRKIPFSQNGFDQINKQSNPTCMLGPRDYNKLQESTSWPQLVCKSKSYFIAI